MLRLVISIWYCLIIFFFFFFFHNSSHVVLSSSSSAWCYPDERSALLQLNATRYNKSADCCTWNGVVCDEATGHVVCLDIILEGYSNNITTNSSLFLLRHLQRLSMLSDHTIAISEAAFKALARNLTRLEVLRLDHIDMSLVPLSALKNLSSSLTSLSLVYCKLYGDLPGNLFHSFPKLETISISSGGRIRISESAFKALARNLTRLRVLRLVGIDMSSVPPESGLLMNLSSSLTSLELSRCQLRGEIPDNVFFHFPKLEYLALSFNNLSGQLPSTPHNFSSNWKTRILYLSDNNLHGPIPSWIYELPYLEWLDLSNNSFTGEIGNFQTSSLSGLWLQNNNLQGVIPRSLFQNVEIHYLDLSSNNLTGDVEFAELSKLKKLSSLDLSFNNLFLGFHNSSNSALENLSILGLSSCHVAEFPHFLKFQHLYSLDLSNNQIQGSVPTWFWESNKDSLEYLFLSNNSLTYIHSLPWKDLRILDLHSNSFSGQLPILSPILQVFLVSKNNFSGEIPISICNLTTLHVLDLSYNNFTGEIPISICNLTTLDVLDLSYNNFIGNIPRCIGNASKDLSVLDLRRNKLHGTIPAIFSTGIRLQTLNLNGNCLEGALPRSLVNCSNLEVLDLGNNMLNDTFPDWLASLPMLQVLVLRANRFHGSIGNAGPRFPFFTLRIMDLSHNEFVGALPTNYFDNFKAMQRDLENTKLGYMGGGYYQDSVVVTMKGQDLELVKILTFFTTIDFSTNNFSGEISESVGKLKSLKGLNLSHNMLTGILPSSLGNLSNLEWLDLSSNELVGKIPLELVDVTSLENLNLSHNHLEGPIPIGKQFNTFDNESYMGNLDLCGFPLTKTCGEDGKPSPPSLEHDDGHDSSITNGFNWKIVMMGYASGFVIGISIGYMVLYSNGKLSWLSDTILEELQYRTRPSRPKRSRNARRS